MAHAFPLSSLNASFLRVRMEPASEYLGRTMPDGTIQWGGFPSANVYKIPHRLGAHGLEFECPDDKSDGHRHQIFFAGEDVPGDLGKNHEGKEVRWEATGEVIDTLSLSPSISTQGTACRWHGWVRNGVLEVD